MVVQLTILLTRTRHQKFDDAVQLVIQQGRFCWLAKGDIKSAFKLAPIRYEDLACLEIKFQDMYFGTLFSSELCASEQPRLRNIRSFN